MPYQKASKNFPSLRRKYLITGVAGFIGSQVSRLLLKQDNEVVGVDNLNDYYDVRLKDWRISQLQCLPQSANFSFKKIDIENRDDISELFEEHKSFDAVLNLAARAGVRYSLENPGIYLSTNILGTLNLLECMKHSGCLKLVLASTSSLYAGQKMPFNEDLSVNEPLSPYATTKKSAELMAYTYHKLYEIDVSILRYFTVFGPAGRPDMSPYRFIKWVYEEETINIYGDGTQSRDFTFVTDIARGTVAAIQKLGYEIINLGGGRKPLSLNTIIKKIEQLIGKKAKKNYLPFHDADMMETWADVGKAKEKLDWEPNVSIDEGLERTVKWYSDNREWLKEVCI